MDAEGPRTVRPRRGTAGLDARAKQLTDASATVSPLDAAQNLRRVAARLKRVEDDPMFRMFIGRPEKQTLRLTGSAVVRTDRTRLSTEMLGCLLNAMLTKRSAR